MERSAITALALAGASMRAAIFGCAVTYQGGNFTVAIGGVEEQQVFDEEHGAMRTIRVATGRVLLSAGMSPKSGKALQVTSSPTGALDGKRFRISKVQPHGVNPEVVMDLVEEV